MITRAGDEPTPHWPLGAVVFDLDGVLIDSESSWDAARKTVVAQTGGRWQPAATEEMMGMSSSEWSQYLRHELGVQLEPEEISRRVVATLLAGYREHLPLLHGAVGTVNRMAAQWRLALASSANRPVIDAVLDASGLAGSFAATVSGDEVAHGKPAPDVYLEAAAKLGVDPVHAAAVEDSSNGMRAAAGAGMFVVAIPNREYPPEREAMSLAGLVLESLDELTPEVLSDSVR